MRPPKSQLMTPPLPAFLIFLLLLHPSLGTCFFLGPRDDSAAHPSPDDPPCTITSPHTGSFFDLRPLIRLPPQNPPSTSSDDTNDDNDAAEWSTSGHDYNATFHLNICHPILTNLTNPIRGGLSPSNISAFYTRDGEHFSLGESSSTLILRGKKLILEYTHGSPCAPSPSQKGFTKSTLISFLCDRDFGVGKADVAFVGQSSDCAYFFEIRTGAACATVHVEEGVGLSPGAIFAVIMSVFFLVYFLGGFFYQRIVMNARGWKQIPHYHTWANLLSTISSFFSSLASPLRRGRSGSVRLPQQNHSRNSSNDFRNSPTGPRAGSGGASSFSRRLSGLGLGNGNSAYSQWGSWGTRSGRAGPIWARGVDEDGEVEDENRLLDQLEGEWDD